MRRDLFIALWLLGCRAEVDPAKVCAEARALGVVARHGAEVDGDLLQAGSGLRCEDDVEAYRSAVAAMQRLPPRLRPAALSLEVEPTLAHDAPRLRGVEMHRKSGALLVTRAVLAEAPSRSSQSVWLHELGHVRARGSRPTGKLAERLFSALDEGFADYFAAVTSGASSVGPEAGEQRDLSAPPRLGAGEWASLAFENAFEPHRFGWAFAGELYREEAQAGALLDDLLSALSSKEPWPTAQRTPSNALDELLRRCPPRSREALAGVLARFVPRELRQG